MQNGGSRLALWWPGVNRRLEIANLCSETVTLSRKDAIMSHIRLRLPLLAILCWNSLWALSHPLSGQTTPSRQPSLQKQLERSTQRLSDHSYELRYRFRTGESLQYEVVHRVSVETTIDEVTQKNRSHSRAIRQWQIVDVE